MAIVLINDEQLWLAEKFVPLQGKKQRIEIDKADSHVVISWKICTFAG